MGHEIVYCGSCGVSLRQEEFEKGRAQVVDDIPYCGKCRPLQAPPSSRVFKPSSSPRVPLPMPSTTRRLKPGMAHESKTALWAGLAVAGAGFLLLIIALASGSGSTPPRAAPPDDPPPRAAAAPYPSPTPAPVRPAPLPPTVEPASAVWDRLSAFAAASNDPDAILVRCDESARVLRGTPFEPRLKEIESGAREKKRRRDEERQLEVSLQGARTLLAQKHRFERREEIVGMLNAAIRIAGPRRAEVQKLLDDFEKEASARPAAPAETTAPAVPAPAAQPPPPSGSKRGPFPLDPSGLVNRWLVLGAFPNDKDQEGLYRKYFDEDHSDPAEGAAISFREGPKIPWRYHAISDGNLNFMEAPSVVHPTKGGEPAVAYAAFWLELERETKFKFRVNADSGFVLWFNRKRLGNRSKGHLLSQNPETFTVEAPAGMHCVLVKVGSIGASLALRVRVTTPTGVTEAAPGVKLWVLGAGLAGQVLYAEDFESGAGKFKGGQVTAPGVGGGKALIVTPEAVEITGVLTKPVGPGTTLRFMVKVLTPGQDVHVLSWSNAANANFWYHVRGLKEGEWRQVEFRMSEQREGAKATGPSLEGHLPSNVRIFLDKGNPEPRAVIDDFEIRE